MMSEERAYLELSEEGGSHKFYEVVVNFLAVALRASRAMDIFAVVNNRFASFLKL